MTWIFGLLELGGLNAILALSVYATFKVGQFSLAQVGFWSIGAHVAGMLTALAGWPLLPALLVAAAFCVIIGIILGYPCLRIRGIYLALATIAFSEVVRVVFHNFTLTVTRDGVPIGPAGAQGFRGIPVLTDWPQILIAVVLVAAAFAWIERSRLGLITDAVREDDVAASCMGIDVVKVRVGMFAFGAAIAAVGGGLYGTYTSFVISDTFGFHLALISIFFIAVGGTGNFAGPIIGAMVLTLLPEMLRFAGDYRMVIYGLIILGLMIVFPKGLTAAFARPRRPVANAGVQQKEKRA